MLPTNVMSFVKNQVVKMVNTQPEPGASNAAADQDGGRAFSKIKQIGTDLISATTNVTKLAPAKVTPVDNIQPKESTPVIEPPKAKTEQEKIAIRAAACRVCLKTIKAEEISRTCYECQRKVCEDCASYSTNTNSDDPTWCCSVCRRKLAPRDMPVLGTESSLDVPLHDGLVRRHSDVRLNVQGALAPSVGALEGGLGPPRSPDLRRHSDVSPASLKELERFRKVAGDRHGAEDWEWRTKSRSGSPDRAHPARERERDRGGGGGGGGGGDRQRVGSPQRREKDQDDRVDPRGRRKSVRMTRQHSYDDEIKNAGMPGRDGGSRHGGHGVGPEGLGLPVQMTRRASAFDVYSTAGPGGLAGIVPPQHHRASISVQGSREPEQQNMGRRASFRVPKPVMPYEMGGGDDEKMINLDKGGDVDARILMPNEESRERRRGSLLPNIDAIKFAQQPSRPAIPGPIARVNVADDREQQLARQGSLADQGEGIKIVIHDVDCDMLPRANSKRKVVLKKEVVVEKGHRTRSFGMRVVGGKRFGDNRLYAVIVWTVAGGPADKAGLQQNDKVLEWGGVSLIDRTFEEVAHIIDRCGDVAELVVEHTTDMSGDQLDDERSGIPAPQEKTPGNLGLGQHESETSASKAPSSPTRRKLPKTPV